MIHTLTFIQLTRLQGELFDDDVSNEPTDLIQQTEMLLLNVIVVGGGVALRHCNQLLV